MTIQRYIVQLQFRPGGPLAEEEVVLASDYEALQRVLRECREEYKAQFKCAAQLADGVVRLTAENERLKAPVSDEEWAKSYWQADGGMRSFVNAFIASRAIQETGVKRDMQSPMTEGDSREKPAPQSTENGK